MPTHLRPTAPIAADALLTGDPKRAMELAAALFPKPLMSNLSRGLWGYHGLAAGRALTVQSTGIGGPSAAIVVGDLASLGVRQAIRVGTCIALDPGLRPGTALVVRSALTDDGVGGALEPSGSVAPDEGLTARLEAAASPARAGIVASTDFYEHPDPARRQEWRAGGAAAMDLSAAAVLAMGRRSGLATACVLVVAESAAGDRLNDDDLDVALLDLGTRAADAFRD